MMPKKRNSGYWEERARQNKLNVIKIGENGINELKRVLKTNLDDVQKEIKAFYDKYGDNPAEELSYKEFEQYKKDLKAKAKKHPDDKTLQRMVKQDIPKYRIDRLRQLEADLQIRLAEVTTYQQTSINGTLTDVAAVSHEATKKMMKESIGLNIGAINSRQIAALISTDWSGKNWSERLWKDREKLGKKLKQTLEKGITQGIGYRKMARELRAEVGTSFNNAFRLIRTESAFIQGDINKTTYQQAAEELGLDEYVYDAFLDSRTSEICRELDGKRFKISEMQIGVNAPPMHPNCRSTTQLVLEGNNKKISAEEAIKISGKETLNLSEKEKTAVKNYTDDEQYKNINKFLRGEIDKLDPKDTQTIKTLENVLDKAELKADITLYRGVAADFIEKAFKDTHYKERFKNTFYKRPKDFEIDDIKDYFKGKIFTEKGFMSTSFDKTKAYDDKEIMLTIKAPTGLKALNVSTLSMHDEAEMLINKGYSFKVADVGIFKTSFGTSIWNFIVTPI